MLNKIYGAMLSAKARFNNFLAREKGGSEIIALVLVIAIVLVLGGVFWDQISEFFADLMDSMLGKNPMSDINKSNVK